MGTQQNRMEPQGAVGSQSQSQSQRSEHGSKTENGETPPSKNEFIADRAQREPLHREDNAISRKQSENPDRKGGEGMTPQHRPAADEGTRSSEDH